MAVTGTRRLLKPVRLEVLAYAPTEFFHCQHCEVVWDHVGLGRRIHDEQRSAGLLPGDLQVEYEAIADWIFDASRHYGGRLQVRLVDVASIEGVLKAVRHRVRRFPTFIIDGQDPVPGFDRSRLDERLAQAMEGASAGPRDGSRSPPASRGQLQREGRAEIRKKRR
jgi:hypothetical protein